MARIVHKNPGPLERADKPRLAFPRHWEAPELDSRRDLTEQIANWARENIRADNLAEKGTSVTRALIDLMKKRYDPIAARDIEDK